MIIARPLLAVCIAGAALGPVPARSAEAQIDTRMREALRSATSQLHALEEERVRWQATDAEQKKEIESLKAQLAAVRSKARREQTLSPELTRRLDEQAEANQKLTSSLTQCQAAVRDAAELASANDEQRAQLTAQVSTLSRRATACEEKNARLYQLTHEFAERVEKEGSDALLGAVEPLLGFKHVHMENLSQDFQDKILEQKVQP
jgi:chromosome segregation ATPase